MTGFVKPGFHPLAGTRGGPPAIEPARRQNRRPPVVVETQAPKAEAKPAAPKRTTRSRAGK